MCEHFAQDFHIVAYWLVFELATSQSIIIIVIVTITTMIVINNKEINIYNKKKKISQHSGDERETAFLFQRASALVQRYSSVLLHNSFV